MEPKSNTNPNLGSRVNVIVEKGVVNEPPFEQRHTIQEPIRVGGSVEKDFRAQHPEDLQFRRELPQKYGEDAMDPKFVERHTIENPIVEGEEVEEEDQEGSRDPQIRRENKETQEGHNQPSKFSIPEQADTKPTSHTILGSVLGGAMDTLSSGVGYVRDTAGSIVEGTKSRIGGAIHAVQDLGSSAQQKAEDITEDVVEEVQGVLELTKDLADAAAEMTAQKVGNVIECGINLAQPGLDKAKQEVVAAGAEIAKEAMKQAYESAKNTSTEKAVEAVQSTKSMAQDGAETAAKGVTGLVQSSLKKAKNVTGHAVNYALGGSGEEGPKTKAQGDKREHEEPQGYKKEQRKESGKEEIEHRERPEATVTQQGVSPSAPSETDAERIIEEPTTVKGA